MEGRRETFERGGLPYRVNGEDNSRYIMPKLWKDIRPHRMFLCAAQTVLLD